MQIRKTSALVEAGILAAIEVVFALVGSYVPVLSLFADFLLPLPIALCGQRNGFKWSLGSLLVAAMIIAIIVNPVQALSVVAVFGLIGLTVGYCMHRRLSPVKLLLFGSLSGLVAIGFSFLIGYLVLGINMIQMMLDSMQQEFSDIPIVMFYPGEFNGQSLSLFDKFHDGNYYRAFNLL